MAHAEVYSTDRDSGNREHSPIRVVEELSNVFHRIEQPVGDDFTFHFAQAQENKFWRVSVKVREDEVIVVIRHDGQTDHSCELPNGFVVRTSKAGVVDVQRVGEVSGEEFRQPG